MTSLDDLPQDLILHVLAYLDTAHDISALARLNHQWHALILRDGWATFIKNRFVPVLDVPSPPPSQTGAPDSDGGRSAAHLADHLTWQDRCWDKRAFTAFTLSEPEPPLQPRGRRGRGRGRGRGQGGPGRSGRQSVAFQTVVAAAPLNGNREQVVVLGAGENISAVFGPLWRRHGRGFEPHKDEWRHVPGRPLGFTPGMGDVTALALLDAEDATSGLVVGRADGSIHLLSAQKDRFGAPLADLTPPSPEPLAPAPAPQGTTTPPTTVQTRPGTRPVSSPAAVSSLHWQPQKRLLLTGTKRAVWLHAPDSISEQGDRPSPLATSDVHLHDGRPAATAFDFVRTARFVNPTTVACGLANSAEPFRWVPLTESGFGPVSGMAGPGDGAAAASRLRDQSVRTVRAIEPIGVLSVASGNENLALSAWDDGTVR